MRRAEASLILGRSLKPARLASRAEPIWEDWPALHNVALKVCWFLSPYLDYAGANLLEQTIQGAVRAFLSAPAGEQARAFLNAIRDGGEALCTLRVSARDGEGGWLLWECEEPLMDWMAALGAPAVQVTRRKKVLEADPVIVRLMAQVCTVRDLRIAGLVVARRSAGQ